MDALEIAARLRHMRTTPYAYAFLPLVKQGPVSPSNDAISRGGDIADALEALKKKHPHSTFQVIPLRFERDDNESGTHISEVIFIEN